MAGIGNNAQNLRIESCIVNNHTSTVTKNTNVRITNSISDLEKKEQVKDLYNHIAIGALLNSDERCDAPKCHEDTRVAVQDEIMSWIANGDIDSTPKRIKWLTGPAGTGKTAIMGTIAEMCHTKGDLAAAFFFSLFSRSTDRKTKTRFVATLAYQLQQHPKLQRAGDGILEAVAKDPGIFNKRLVDQLDSLILQPLRDAHYSADRSSYPKVILVDGLDECEAVQYHDLTLEKQRQPLRTNADDQTEILNLLLRASQDPWFPFRIIIASRPEPAIRRFFAEGVATDCTVELFLDSKYNPDADIELFLRSKFTELRRRYNLSIHWPTEASIKALVESASGQFIYAATVIRFVETPLNPPHIQLEQVLRLRAADASNPFALLDALYTSVLNTSPDPLLAVKWILEHGTISNSFTDANYVRLFLEGYSGETEYLFANLSSLVWVATATTPKHFAGQPLLRVYHKSLLDFLKDPGRSGKFYVRDRRQFQTECYVRVLMNQGPAVASHHSYVNAAFLRFFSHWAVQGCQVGLDTGDWDSVLLSCDADWWAREAITHQGESDDYLLLRQLFFMCHQKCSKRHLPICTYWTKALTSAMQELKSEEPDMRLHYGFYRPVPRSVMRMGSHWVRVWLTFGNRDLENNLGSTSRHVHALMKRQDRPLDEL